MSIIHKCACFYAGTHPSRPSRPTTVSGSGGDGSYTPTSEGQYTHVTGPQGAGPEPYEHVTGIFILE